MVDTHPRVPFDLPQRPLLKGPSLRAQGHFARIFPSGEECSEEESVSFYQASRLALWILS